MYQQWTKTDKLWLGIIIGFILAIFILPTNIEVQEKIILQNEGGYQFDKYMYLDYALNKIADQEYILDKYDCEHFSKDLVKGLAKYNIKAETIIVDDDYTNPRHMIVGVWFEPQDGKLVRTHENYRRVK